MPRIATYEPMIVAALKQAGMEAGRSKGGSRVGTRGMTVEELAAACACSRSQVYKTVDKLTRAGMVTVAGKSATGANLFAWIGGDEQEAMIVVDAGGEAGRHGGTFNLRLDAVLRVVAMRRVKGGAVVVELEDEAGQVIEIVTAPRSD